MWLTAIFILLALSSYLFYCLSHKDYKKKMYGFLFFLLVFTIQVIIGIVLHLIGKI